MTSRKYIFVTIAMLFTIGCDKEPQVPLCTAPLTIVPCDKGCVDGKKDGYDTDVDCGGTNPVDDTSWCGPCLDGKTCVSGTDCLSLVCVNQICRAPACNDGVKNGPESDTDCGNSTRTDAGTGAACPTCTAGKRCLEALDCQSQICENNICSPSLCGDGQRNASETDVDCGGPVCPPCKAGKACLRGTDCMGGTCFNNVCA